MKGKGLSSPAAARVRRHARAFVKDLDGGRCGPNLDKFVHKVAEDTVEVGVDIELEPSAATKKGAARLRR